MMAAKLRLVSHHLCPYVQRAAIALAEKGAVYEREYVDLAAKPEWFTRISPLGKVPLLLVDGTNVLFESAVICEYLEEVVDGPPLHPADPLERARHRGWVEVASAILNDIWGFYTAADSAALERKREDMRRKFATLEAALGEGPFFAGSAFSLVDAAFGPVFRYFDVFETFMDPRVFDDMPRLARWRRALAARPSVRDAVLADYPQRLAAFLRARNSHLTSLMERAAA